MAAPRQIAFEDIQFLSSVFISVCGLFCFVRRRSSRTVVLFVGSPAPSSHFFTYRECFDYLKELINESLYD